MRRPKIATGPYIEIKNDKLTGRLYQIGKIVRLIPLFLLLYKGSFAQQTDSIIIENVNVIPMTGRAMLYNKSVWIAGDKILKIEDADISVSCETCIIIDGKDKYLIPGLSEMHYHLRGHDVASDLKLLLANGITTVRNMAERPGQDQIAIRTKTQSGQLPRVNYFTAGPYLQNRDLGSMAQINEVVSVHKEKGYDFLKIADNLPKPLYLKLLEECQDNGIPVIGHAQRELPVEYSLRMKSIEHIEEFLYLSDTVHGKNFFKANRADLNKLAEQIQSSEIYIGTTLIVFDFINNCLDNLKFDSLKHSTLTKYIDREERENFLTEKNDYRKLKDKFIDGLPAKELFANYFSWMKEFAQILAAHDVLLLTGSDTYGMVVPGLSLHQEFYLLQQSGISPYDILKATTVTAARYLGIYGTSGTITEGKNADLVLLDKNPLEDIRNTSLITGVMLKGRWLDKKQLDRMLLEVERAYQ